MRNDYIENCNPNDLLAIRGSSALTPLEDTLREGKLFTEQGDIQEVFCKMTTFVQNQAHNGVCILAEEVAHSMPNAEFVTATFDCTLHGVRMGATATIGLNRK